MSNLVEFLRDVEVDHEELGAYLSFMGVVDTLPSDVIEQPVDRATYDRIFIREPRPRGVFETLIGELFIPIEEGSYLRFETTWGE